MPYELWWNKTFHIQAFRMHFHLYTGCDKQKGLRCDTMSRTEYNETTFVPLACVISFDIITLPNFLLVLFFESMPRKFISIYSFMQITTNESDWLYLFRYHLLMFSSFVDYANNASTLVVDVDLIHSQFYLYKISCLPQGIICWSFISSLPVLTIHFDARTYKVS